MTAKLITQSIAAALVALSTLWSSAAAIAESKPASRAEATKILADMRRIVTENGVERLEKIRIGGIDQWISIRGTDRRNPVLLMLHGGPGYVSMPTSWYFQRGWEEYFTVVQWDQRGAGKTYAANDPEKIAPTLTIPRMVADTEELIGWLRREFDRERIFVLGHSWGSVLGLKIAERHPDWLHAYIGMGQGTDVPESERRGWQFAMERARADGNQKAIEELESIAPYAEAGQSISLRELAIQRKWLNHYGGAVHGRKDGSHEAAAAALAPEYSDADLKAMWAGNELSESRLLSEVVGLDLSTIDELDCPIILLNGRHDYNVSSRVAAEWFERLKAPSKKLVWFEHSAHEIMNEEPGKVLVSLVQHARPIAERAGDVAPR